MALTFRLTTAAAAGLRGIRVDILDGDGHIAASNMALSMVTASQQITVVGDQQWPSAPGLPASNNTYGSAAAPGAGAAIATTPVLPAGLYQVAWPAEVSGAVAAGTDNDTDLDCRGGDAGSRGVPGSSGCLPAAVRQRVGAAATAIIIKALGAATAGTTYATFGHRHPGRV